MHRQERRARLELSDPAIVGRELAHLRGSLEEEANPLRRMMLEDAIEDCETVLASADLPLL